MKDHHERTYTPGTGKADPAGASGEEANPEAGSLASEERCEESVIPAGERHGSERCPVTVNYYRVSRWSYPTPMECSLDEGHAGDHYDEVFYQYWPTDYQPQASDIWISDIWINGEFA
jgi:hypothetical protein